MGPIDDVSAATWRLFAAAAVAILLSLPGPALAGMPPPAATEHGLEGGRRMRHRAPPDAEVELLDVGETEIGPEIPAGVICAWRRHSRVLKLRILVVTNPDLRAELVPGQVIEVVEVSNRLPARDRVLESLVGRCAARLRKEGAGWKLESIRKAGDRQRPRSLLRAVSSKA